MEFWKDLLLAALGAAFGLGGALAMLKQLRRDVNGLGRKVNTLKDASLIFCPQEQREKMGQFFNR